MRWKGQWGKFVICARNVNNIRFELLIYLKLQVVIATQLATSLNDVGMLKLKKQYS